MTPPHSFTFDQFVVTDQGGTLCPAIVADPGVTDQYLVSNWTGEFQGSGYLALFRIDGTVADGTTDFTRVGFLELPNTWSFNFPGDRAPQQGTNEQRRHPDPRLLFSPALQSSARSARPRAKTKSSRSRLTSQCPSPKRNRFPLARF